MTVSSTPNSDETGQQAQAAADHSTRLPLSVFAVTLNEAANIARMLESVRSFADEMIVVDCGSADATVAIAKAMGADVVEHPWEGYARQKQFAMDQCRHDWCLCLDADEMVTAELAAGIGDLLEDDSVAAYRLARTDVFAGATAPRFLYRQGGTRLMRKSRCRFDISRTVHEKLIIDGEERRIELGFLHFGYGDLTRLTEKNNKYSGLKAREKAARGKSPSLLRLLFSGPVKFLQLYFVQRYFLWGWRGFALSVATAYYAFCVDAKQFELAARKEQEQIEED